LGAAEERGMKGRGLGCWGGVRALHTLSCLLCLTESSFSLLCVCAQADYAAARAEMEKEAKRAAKVEQKVNILVGGLQQRDKALRGKLAEMAEQLEAAHIELTCFRALKQRELRAAPDRIEKALELLGEQKQREGDLQERYKALTRERADIAAGRTVAAAHEA
jgi:pre-mRNA-splicing factor CDC5/CEF1